MQTQVLIIGAGITGTGLARDLALRGIPSIVVDQGDFNSGASGSNHSLLHSGARSVAADPESAAECRRESVLLKRLAPHCVEESGGLFVAVQGDEERTSLISPACAPNAASRRGKTVCPVCCWISRG